MSETIPDKELLTKVLVVNNNLVQQLVAMRLDLDKVITAAQQEQVAFQTALDVTTAPATQVISNDLFNLLVRASDSFSTEYLTELRTYNGLTATGPGIKGVHSVADLLEQTEIDLLKIENIGRRSLSLIKNRLAECGLKLKD
jgi:hypothetical protein